MDDQGRASARGRLLPSVDVGLRLQRLLQPEGHRRVLALDPDQPEGLGVGLRRPEFVALQLVKLLVRHVFLLTKRRFFFLCLPQTEGTGRQNWRGTPKKDAPRVRKLINRDVRGPEAERHRAEGGGGRTAGARRRPAKGRTPEPGPP